MGHNNTGFLAFANRQQIDINTGNPIPNTIEPNTEFLPGGEPDPNYVQPVPRETTDCILPPVVNAREGFEIDFTGVTTIDLTATETSPYAKIRAREWIQTGGNPIDIANPVVAGSDVSGTALNTTATIPSTDTSLTGDYYSFKITITDELGQTASDAFFVNSLTFSSLFFEVSNGGNYPSSSVTSSNSWAKGILKVTGDTIYYVWLYVDNKTDSTSTQSSTGLQTVSVDIKDGAGNVVKSPSASAAPGQKKYSNQNITVVEINSTNVATAMRQVASETDWYPFGAFSNWTCGFAYNTTGNFADGVTDLFVQSV